MLQGTASSVGKSTLVAGLCRLFRNRGVNVAPFKAQNMSNNAAVCRDGGEIGRAQFAQAIAARVEPTVDMNPVLLKPQGNATSQVIVRGRVHAVHSAREYFSDKRQTLWPVVENALDSLRSTYDLVIAEGAGSPAEINLRERDIVNMRVALHTDAEVLLVADIDRGGAFAALLGTWQWLSDGERPLVKGFILNKFRGDPALLAPAPELLMERTGVRVVGVVPYVSDLRLPEEDAASLSQSNADVPLVEIAVIRLPHLANFDEFAPMAAEPGVHVRYVTRSADLRAPDLVILPGTKATIPDLQWLHDRGIAERICWLAKNRTPVLGICGGLQMLGESVADPLHLESDTATCRGLELLPLQTELDPEKRLIRMDVRFQLDLPGVWSALAGVEAEGYEIHVGRSKWSDRSAYLPFVTTAIGADGYVTPDGLVAGTYLHGLVESEAPRRALIAALATRRGFTWQPSLEGTEDPYDRLASVLETSVDLSELRLR
jgi:adenosylcobyric acid synthase